MGYPKLATKEQADAVAAQLARSIRRDLSAACYVRDRAHQYVTSSGSHDALMTVAAQLERGEHFEAFKVGELDDLIEEAMKRRSDRIRREAEAYAKQVEAEAGLAKGPSR